MGGLQEYYSAMMETMSAMTQAMYQSQAQIMAATAKPPETTTVEPVDWDAKKAALQEELTKQQNDNARRARGTAYTLMSSPLLDSEEPDLVRI